MACYVYLITDGIFTKVGISKHPEKRLTDLQVANPRKLHIAYVVKHDSKEEALTLEWFLHRHFKDANVLGEWIAMPPDIIKKEIPSVQEEIQRIELERYNQSEQSTKDAVEQILKNGQWHLPTFNIALQYKFDALVASDTTYSKRYIPREIKQGLTLVSLVKKRNKSQPGISAR